MFFYKRLISQYEARIKDLQQQIQDLRTLALPTTVSRSVPLISLEADAIISGKDEIYDLSDAERAEKDDEISERDRVLSGNY